MSSKLTEDDMRRALGLDNAPFTPPPSNQPAAVPATLTNQPAPRPTSKAKTKSRTPKLKVLLSVSQVFEGETTLLPHEADTLSRFDAEQQARVLAKKAKYRYVELVSITPIE